MFGILSDKLYVGGYSPVYNIVTYTGKTQAKKFENEALAQVFIDEHNVRGVIVPFN